MLTNEIGVYKITNTTNGKIYVGSTIDGFRRRRNQHFNKLKRNAHENPKLQNSFNKHGHKAFVFEVIEILSKNSNKEFVIERETYYYNKLTKNMMYNLKEPMPSGKFSKETRARMSSAKDEIKRSVAKICLRSFRILEVYDSVNVAAKTIGKDASTIYKCANNVTRTAYGFTWIFTSSLHNPKKGLTRKEKNETKEKIKPKWNPPIKGVCKLNISTGKIIDKYKSLKEASISVNGHSSNISRCANEKARTAYGYGWSFV